MDISTNIYFGSFQKFIVLAIPFLIASSLYGQDCISPTSKQEIQGQAIAQIPFTIHSGLIQITARINDSKELKMYFDSGMSAPIVALFHKELIEEIRLKNTQQVLLGGAGADEQKQATLSSGAVVKLIDIEMANQTIVVFDDSRQTSKWQVDGIMGRTILDSYVTEIDYENFLITLYDQADFKIENGFTSIPFTLEMGMPFIQTTVNIDGSKEIQVKLILDLGHRNALFLMNDSAKNILPPPITITSAIGRGIQGEVSTKIGRIKELKLGDYPIKNLPTSFIEEGANVGLGKDMMDGDLGQLTFNRFNIIFDYKNKQIFLTPNKNFNKPFEFDMAGFGFLEQDRDDTYLINYIVENSPASENDIRKGDKIISINGKNVLDYDYYEVYDLLRQEGKEIKLTIERGDERLEKILKLRRLL
ncbi:MAG: hypothetical protein A2V66_05140 [Ignavibacteria bacterium RBG_13_36_8]|nr:MAG: hypothetical protein A2V66_05140 [Ignavibacteria bacterium RBG_13_36_8]